MRTRFVLRFLGPIAVVSLLLLAVGVGAAWYLSRIQSSNSRVLVQNVTSLRAAEALEIAMLEVRGHLDRFLVKADFHLLDQVPALRKQTEMWLDSARNAATTPPEHELLTLIAHGHDHFFREYDRLTQQKQPQELFSEISSLMDRLLFEEMLEPTRAYRRINEEMLAEATARNQQRAEFIRVVILGVAIGGSCLGLLIGLVLAWSIRRAIVQIQVQLRGTAGILNEVAGPLVVRTGEDLQDVEGALEQLTEPITKLISRLEQSQKEALRAEQLAMVGQLAAGIAHEVRNPLTAIKILVQAGAERQPNGHLGGRDLIVLEKEISRLEQLISSFLDFARPPQPQMRSIDLQRTLEQVVDLLAAKAELHTVTLQIDSPAEPIIVQADSGQFHQLLLNLTLNAIEASLPGGTVTIRVRCHHDGEQRWLNLAVLDEGNGLPENLGPSIFEPFVSGKETGMGLGLSVCRRVVEMHRGNLYAENLPEGGACFTATIPLPSLAS